MKSGINFDNILGHCELCPRKCGINRLAGELGFCRGGPEAEVYRYAPHYGEEPPISGNRGSGTVFFSRCTLRCLYCQNYPFSQEGKGHKVSVKSLADIMVELREMGCHNWNLVSPTHWLPMILGALEIAKSRGAALPVVYNTSGYERVEILRSLDGAVDVYLADLRYADETTAARASSAVDYVTNMRGALLEMWRQTGALKLGLDGMARSGLICRILILPGLADEACENIRWLADNIGTDVTLSVMSQYTPAYRAAHLSYWNRNITADEYRRVCGEVEKRGFTNGWMQGYHDQTNQELIGFNMPTMNEKAECRM